MLWNHPLVHCKDFHPNWSNKMLIDQQPGRKYRKATKLKRMGTREVESRESWEKPASCQASRIYKTWGISNATRETYGRGKTENQVTDLRCGEWKNSFSRSAWWPWAARHQYPNTTTSTMNLSASLFSPSQSLLSLLSHWMLSLGRAEEAVDDHRAKLNYPQWATWARVKDLGKPRFLGRKPQW